MRKEFKIFIGLFLISFISVSCEKKKITSYQKDQWESIKGRTNPKISDSSKRVPDETNSNNGRGSIVVPAKPDTSAPIEVPVVEKRKPASVDIEVNDMYTISSSVDPRRSFPYMLERATYRVQTLGANATLDDTYLELLEKKCKKSGKMCRDLISLTGISIMFRTVVYNLLAAQQGQSHRLHPMGVKKELVPLAIEKCKSFINDLKETGFDESKIVDTNICALAYSYTMEMGGYANDLSLVTESITSALTNANAPKNISQKILKSMGHRLVFNNPNKQQDTLFGATQSYFVPEPSKRIWYPPVTEKMVADLRRDLERY